MIAVQPVTTVHFRVKSTLQYASAIAALMSTPDADTACEVLVLVTTSEPLPGGIANKIEGGITNWPA